MAVLMMDTRFTPTIKEGTGGGPPLVVTDARVYV